MDSKRIAKHNFPFQMCVLALLLWVMSVLDEFKTIAKQLVAFLRLRCNGNKTIVVENEICSICTARLCMLLLVMAARLIIASALMYVGAMFLVSSVSISLLLMKAMALKFVLGVDELVFSILAPIPLRTLVKNTKPMPLPPVRAWKGLDSNAVASCVAVMAFLIPIVLGLLLPQMDVLREAEDALCGGELSFVASTANADGQPLWSWSPGERKTGSRPWRGLKPGEYQYHSFAVRGVDAVLLGLGRPDLQCEGCYDEGFQTNSNPTCCWARGIVVPNVTGNLYSVQEGSEATINTVARTNNPDCMDVLDWPASYVWQLQAAYADGLKQNDPQAFDACGGSCTSPYQPTCINGVCAKPNCADVAPYCNAASELGIRARQNCPVTCGCANISSSLYNFNGCGPFCKLSYIYQASVDALPCSDSPVGSKQLEEYANAWETFSRSVPYPGMANGALGASLIKKYGCGYVGSAEATAAWGFPSSWKAMWCGYYKDDYTYGPVAMLGMKPLISLCPIACGCKSGAFMCPTTCPAN